MSAPVAIVEGSTANLLATRTRGRGLGYSRDSSAPSILPAHEAAKHDRERYAPRAPLDSDPQGRKIYRLTPRLGTGSLSERLRELLDPEQSAAVQAATGRTLIVAAAGTGKTRVITSIVAHLTETGVEPRNIMLVTFTRRAAREMTQRAQDLSGRDLREMTAGTFHSVCQRILRRFGSLIGLPTRFTVLDAQDQADMLRIARDRVTKDQTQRASLPRPEWIANVHALAQESGRPLASVIVDENPRLADRIDTLVEICAAYQADKKAAAAVDYADLLTLTVRLLDEHPDVRRRLAHDTPWVLVDELHDVNQPQATIVECLADEGARVIAVADPDQSIYAWRGADPEVVERFSQVEGTAIVRLGRNYRSTPEIVSLAQECLPQGNPWGKQMVAHRVSTGVRPVIAHCLSIADEAAFVTQRIADLITEGREPGDIGILYRAHHHSADIQVALSQAGVEFELYSGARFVESAHIKDVLAACRIRHNPRDSLSWHRLLRLFPGVGERRASMATQLAQAQPDMVHGLRAAANVAPDLARACDVLAPIASLDRPEDIILKVARSDWFRDGLQNRFPNWRDREADIARLAEIATRARDLESLLADLQLAERLESDEDVSGPAKRVALSSVHQAKGLEWPVVFVLQVEAGSFPSSWALSEGRLDEEERLFYVALTRARDELYLCRPVQAKRPWDTGPNSVVINAGLGFLDRDFGDRVEEWSVR